VDHDAVTRSGDFVGRIASNEKAKKELGWEPKTDLEEGISRYIEWYKSFLKKKAPVATS